MQISGATVLLTGASGGLGQAIARALGRRGASLIVTGRRAEVLQELADELGARALAVDLAKPAEIDRLLSEAGEIDILVANAALPASGTLDSFSIDRKSTRLNSSHGYISYAVFCLKKKKKTHDNL